MSFLSNAARLLIGPVADKPEPPVTLQARSHYEYPAFETQMHEIWNRRGHDTYRSASVKEALGVPAIFGAVSLISNTVGSLSMEAFRKGVRMPMEDAPRLIQRPNPFSTLRDFLRDTAYYVATRGEAWWYVAVRDPVDDSPMSLYPVPPWEVTVSIEDNDRLRPVIKWADRIIPNDRMRHITYLPDHDGLRGLGPLQLCGAAVSVSVEAQEWAANFFSGSIPSIIGTTEQDMTDDELRQLDNQWVEKPSNLPRWLTNGMVMSDSPFDPEKAQLNEARQSNVGDVARMFSMPGSLLEHQMSGSSLTYRNDEGIWTDFQRRCLSPHYLEPIEQEMSDLLTRSTVSRFNLKQLLRSDAKTRMEVHQLAIETGIYDANTAAIEEGYEPGNADFAPVPFAAPQAVPSSLPPDRELRTALEDVRCPKCGKLAGRVSGAAEIRCQRCRSLVTVSGVQVRTEPHPLTAAVPAPNITTTVHPPSVTFEAGAFQVAAPDMAPMTELAGSITELAARPAPANEITVQPAEVHIDEGAVRVEFTPSPVTVEPAQITVEPPNVTINVPEPKPTARRIERDDNDNIIRIVEESA
jgi:HK97 family phage portal protein